MSNRDIEKTLRTQAQPYRQMGNDAQGDILDRAADEIKTLRMAVDLHEQGAELMREELAALKEAARLLILTTQPVLGEDGHLWITEHAVDALAALVGEE